MIIYHLTIYDRVDNNINEHYFEIYGKKQSSNAYQNM